MGEGFVVFSGVSHVYMGGTPFERLALAEVSLSLGEGERVGLAGATGSGKSTLIQHLNGLLRPTTGQVCVGGLEISPRGGDLGGVRELVGMLFQFPEHQLFEETVEADVGFGPRNQGLRGAELRLRVEEALVEVGLDPSRFRERSPFTLSGGEKRRVALAGVLARRPRLLVLDEPTAGLDPRGAEELLERLEGWGRQPGRALVVVSHRMEELAVLVDRLIVLGGGRVVEDGPLRALFAAPERLAAAGLEIPEMARLGLGLGRAGFPLDRLPVTVEEAEGSILRGLGRAGGS